MEVRERHGVALAREEGQGHLLPKVDAEDLVEIDGMVEGLAAARRPRRPRN